MMIDEKSAMTVRWCKETYSLTSWVLGFEEKKNVLLKKNSLLAGTSYQIKSLRLKRSLDWLGYYRTPAVEMPL